MKAHAMFLILGVTLATALPSASEAQTCRVRSGMTGSGSTYMEVYEYDYVEEKPEFPGGSNKMMCFINDNRRYPAEAYANGIEGRVLCSFVVNPDGNVSHVTVIKGVEHSLNTEAVRILSQMPTWTPGKISGQTVPVRVVCAVPFRK